MQWILDVVFVGSRGEFRGSSTLNSEII